MTIDKVKKIASTTISLIDDSHFSHYGIDAVDELTKILNKQIGQSFRKERIKSKIKNFFNI